MECTVKPQLSVFKGTVQSFSNKWGWFKAEFSNKEITKAHPIKNRNTMTSTVCPHQRVWIKRNWANVSQILYNCKWWMNKQMDPIPNQFIRHPLELRSKTIFNVETRKLSKQNVCMSRYTFLSNSIWQALVKQIVQCVLTSKALHSSYHNGDEVPFELSIHPPRTN